MDTDNRADDQRKYESLPLEVLWEIFGWRNTLSPGDLLSCRAVCKTWRDGATSFLLNQNSLAVVLRFRVDEVEGGTYSSMLTNNAPHSTSTLSDLSDCISNSPAFPSTTIYFDGDYVKVNTGDNVTEWEPWERQQNLPQFFLLHGPKMKRLGLRASFPAKALQSILYDHMPNLECLDLQTFDEFFESRYDGTGMDTILRPDFQKNIGLKEIILSYDWSGSNRKLLKELLQISPKLIKIHNVNIEALKLLLLMKKSHLIQSCYWSPEKNDFLILEEFADLFKSPLPLLPCPHASRPVLSKLDFTFVDIFGQFPGHNLLILALNSILEGNKDTLKYLSFDTIPQEMPNAHPIKIPSMPKLVSLRLVELHSRHVEGDPNEIVMDINWDKGFRDCSAVTNYAPDMSATYSWNVFQFDGQGNSQDRNNNKSKIPQNYFPLLRKVDLRVERDIRSWHKLVGFFAMDRLGEVAQGQGAPPSVITGDRILSVTELEIPCFVLGSDQLSRMFPNISSLTITSPCKFRNTVWTTFPLLKRFEICERPNVDKKSVPAIDSFFTGIPEELCVRFLSEPTAGFSLSSAQVKLFRTEPYIGDCQKLTEFKINFRTRLEATFASKVSAVYGFRELGPQTKCIFSFQSLGLSRKHVADMRRWLAPLRPYVHIET